ncbi:MAG: sulfatase-like hydrolase/transferase [Chloroflexi bacterium]|nr:sulfatase-like hydrolase/transferase [Chloroflexota bacterium]
MARPDRPNLVYIFTDQQRADTMAAYGNDWIETPNLNRLADDSFVFENAYVSSPICTPSRSTLMTGLWPHTNGCIKNNIPLPDNVKTLADFFPANYHTAYYGKWHLGDEVIKRRGWDEWHTIEDQYRGWHTKPEYDAVLSDYHHYLVGLGYGPDKESRGKKVFSRPFTATLPEERTKATYLGDRVGEFIGRNKDRPFAICVNFLEPHPPYTGPLDDLYDPAELPQSPAFMVDPPENAAGMHRLMAEAQKTSLADSGTGTEGLFGRDLPPEEASGEGPAVNSEQEFRRIQASYYGLVTLMDRAVGRILDAINDAGIADRTIVVFTSEHGDQMGEHNIFQKVVMYEQSVKVPFLLRVPWLDQDKVAGRYSHIDTIPTLLELMGLDIPGHLQGVSRAELLRGGGSLGDNDVFIDWNGRSIDQEFPLSELERMREIPHRGVVTGDGWKLNVSVGDQCELYDLNSDPFEQTNLYDDPVYSDRVVELARKIRRWQIETGDTALIPDVYPGVGHVAGMR